MDPYEIFPKDIWIYILNYVGEPNIFRAHHTLAKISKGVKMPISMIEKPPTVLEMFRWLRHNHQYTFRAVAEPRWTYTDEEVYMPFIVRTTCDSRIRIYRQGSRRKLWIRGRSYGRIFLCPQTLPIYIDLLRERKVFNTYSEEEVVLATIKYQYSLAMKLWSGPRSKILFGLKELAEEYTDLELSIKLNKDYNTAEGDLYSDHEDSDDDSITGEAYCYIMKDSKIIPYDDSDVPDIYR